MRFRIGRSLAISAGLAAILVASTPQDGKADLQIRINQLAGPSGPVGPLVITDRVGAIGDPNDLNPTLNGIFATGQFGDFTATSQITAGGNSPGDAVNGSITVRTLAIRNNSSGTATATIEITSDNFSLPGTPPVGMLLRSTFSGSYVNAGANDIATFLGGADPGNAHYVQTVDTGLQTGTVAIPNSGLTNAFNITPSGTSPTVAFFRTGDYSLTGFLTITLSAGATFNLEGVVTAISPVPEPGTTAMAFSALPLLAFMGTRLRRRKLQA